MAANTSLNLPDDVRKEIQRDRQHSSAEGMKFNLSALATHLLRKYYAQRRAARKRKRAPQEPIAQG